jgi:hypothetical protein
MTRDFTLSSLGCDRSGHHGNLSPERAAGSGHRTSLDDGHQDRHTGKKASVIGHGNY